MVWRKFMRSISIKSRMRSVLVDETTGLWTLSHLTFFICLTGDCALQLRMRKRKNTVGKNMTPFGFSLPSPAH